MLRAIATVVAAAAAVHWLQAPCLDQRRVRTNVREVHRSVVRGALTECAFDDAACRARARPVSYPPPADGEGYTGEDSLYCRCVLRLPSLVGAWAAVTVAPTGEVADGLGPVHKEAWFADQCACRWVRALPGWVQWWSESRAGYHDRLLLGEVVSDISAEEVLARARESPLFFEVRGPQLARWLGVGEGGGAVDDGASLVPFLDWMRGAGGGDEENQSGEGFTTGPVFYNEAYAVRADPQRAGVVVRNVWVRRHTTGVVLARTRYDLVMHEYEIATWPTGTCACAPDAVRLEGLAHSMASKLRNRIPF